MRQLQETRQEACDQALKAQVLQVVGEHPAYGYRRIRPELKDSFGVRVNHKRLRRVFARWDLALPRRVRKPKARSVHQILRRGKGQLNLLQGWSPRGTGGTIHRLHRGAVRRWEEEGLPHGAARRGKWLGSWLGGGSERQPCAGAFLLEKARKQLEAIGRGTTGLIVHQDQAPVYTSHDWLWALLLEAVAVVSYSERGAKDNPWIESLWGHFKVENGSLLIEAETLEELEWVVTAQMTYYNERRRHSSLDYVAPVEYLKSEGLHLEPLAQNTPSTGSAAGAHVRFWSDTGG